MAAMFLSFAVQSAALAIETSADSGTEQSADASAVSDTPETEQTEQESKKTGRWYTAKSGNVYYYNENDKKLNPHARALGTTINETAQPVGY